MNQKVALHLFSLLWPWPCGNPVCSKPPTVPCLGRRTFFGRIACFIKVTAVAGGLRWFVAFDWTVPIKLERRTKSSPVISPVPSFLPSLVPVLAFFFLPFFLPSCKSAVPCLVDRLPQVPSSLAAKRFQPDFLLLPLPNPTPPSWELLPSGSEYAPGSKS